MSDPCILEEVLENNKKSKRKIISTKKEGIKTFVWHELIEKKPLFSMDATPQKLNQVSMLESGYNLDLVLKLFQPLTRFS
jgi:hypothetical protein